MKAESTLRKHIVRLRRIVDSPNADCVSSRVAYESEQLLRWVLGDTRGRPSPADSALETAILIRRDLRVPPYENSTIASTALDDMERIQ